MLIKIKYIGSGENAANVTVGNSYVLINAVLPATFAQVRGVILDDNGEIYMTLQAISNNTSVWVVDSATDIGCINL